MNSESAGRIAARLAIADTLNRYCIALDEMDLESLSALFTADCRVVYGDHPALRSEGNKALGESLQRMWRWSRTSHHLTNIVIDFDGDDSAAAVSYVLAWHERADGSTATIYGQYRDRLVQRSGHWLIRERRMLMNGSDTGFTVPIVRLDRRRPPAGWRPPVIEDPDD